MRESRTYGSVRGARGDARPYRDRYARNDREARRVNPKLSCSNSAPVSLPKRDTLKRSAKSRR
jgi:hypothetical protein